jgi:hypothetical protein
MLSAETGTCHNSKGKPASEALTNCQLQMRDKLGQQKKASKREAPTSCRAQTEGQVSRLKKASEERGKLTACRARTDGQVRTVKEARKRGVLTNCRAQTGGQVRTAKASERAEGTHKLSSTDRRRIQDSEMKQASDGHSCPVAHG